jgi:membrane peptidoglycan carboxypeptidase
MNDCRTRLFRRNSSRNFLATTKLPVSVAVLAASFWCLLVGGLMVTFAVLLAGEVQTALPPANLGSADNIFQSSTVYARDGATVLQEIVDPDLGQRTVVPLSTIAPAVIAATVATEDADFFDHPGFDIRGIGRAVYELVVERRVASGSGGSTITQQVARRVLLSQREGNERTFTRKIKEIILAYQLTRQYSKERVLELYLNEIYYGNNTYGIEAAARGYFGKSAQDLTIGEATFLAGLPQSPFAYDPRLHPNAARGRQTEVLARLHARGEITTEQAQEIFASTPAVLPRQFNHIAPHFVVMLQGLVESQFGTDLVRRGGLNIVSTLDDRTQTITEEVVVETQPTRNALKANNLAIVALDPRDGDVLAIVGSADFNDTTIAGQLNMTTHARQPGSVILPYLWASHLSAGRSLADWVVDEPFTIADGVRRWQPTNADGAYRGRVSLRTAIHEGLIGPAIRDRSRGDLSAFAELLAAAGAPGPSRQIEVSPTIVTRGTRVTPFEVATAYATLANGGTYHRPGLLREVRHGETNIASREPDSRRVLPSANSYQILSALAHDREDGRLDASPIVVAGQTEDHRDAWGVYLHPRIVIVAWVGNTNGERPSSDASAAAVDLVGQIAERLALPDEAFERPDNLREVTLCIDITCRQWTREIVPEDSVALVQRRAIDPPSAMNSDQGGLDRRVPAQVALGPAIPAVSGLTWTAAADAIRLAGLRPVRDSLSDVRSLNLRASSVRPGTVIMTDPPTGQFVPPDSDVRVIVSGG